MASVAFKALHNLTQPYFSNLISPDFWSTHTGFPLPISYLCPCCASVWTILSLLGTPAHGIQETDAHVKRTANAGPVLWIMSNTLCLMQSLTLFVAEGRTSVSLWVQRERKVLPAATPHPAQHMIMLMA